MLLSAHRMARGKYPKRMAASLGGALLSYCSVCGVADDPASVASEFLKVLHGSLAATVRDGVAQTRDYMDRSAAKEGHLVIFDRAPDVRGEALPPGRTWRGTRRDGLGRVTRAPRVLNFEVLARIAG